MLPANFNYIKVRMVSTYILHVQKATEHDFEESQLETSDDNLISEIVFQLGEVFSEVVDRHADDSHDHEEGDQSKRSNPDYHHLQNVHYHTVVHKTLST